jgi:creatinine amidohydrolase
VYVYWFPHPKDAGGVKVEDKLDMHAGQSETSVTMISRPDLVHQDRAKEESGEDLHRQNLPDGVYTGIWWYARFPNHYSGDGSLATKELGEYDMKAWEDGIANVIRSVKADQTSLELQNQFYRDAEHPLDTKQ